MYGKIIHIELEKVEEAPAAQIFYIVLPGVVIILSHYHFILISIQVDRHHQSSGQLSGQLTPVGQMAGIGAFGNPQAALEASVLVHNVTRIAQVPCMHEDA